MATHETIQRTLAFLLITGSKRGLTYASRVAIMPWTEYEETGMRREILTEEGERIAKAHKMWKAHEALLALGFEVEPQRYHGRRNHTLRNVRYVHPSDPDRRWGSVGVDGFAYATPEGKRWSSERIGRFTTDRSVKWEA